MLRLYLKAGWKIKRTRGSHHIVYKGKEKESIPVHSKDIKKGLEKYLLKRLKEIE